MSLSHHILIVEAGAPLQVGLVQQFGRWGFAHVTAVATGAAALQQAAAQPPDLVVLSAPQAEHEFELAYQLQAQCGPVPVLVLVPETWQLLRLPASWPGISSSRCVAKPPTPEQLQQGVEDSLHLSLDAVP
jgi:CheY-like chemotaxis protein